MAISALISQPTTVVTTLLAEPWRLRGETRDSGIGHVSL